jgi:3-methyladenine DNA glycosylase Tag
MESFATIYAQAVASKGSVAALEEMLPVAKSPEELAKVADASCLAEMTKCVFRSGFVWKVVEAKWRDFEDVFQGFNPRANAAMSDERIEQLVTDARVIRHYKKIASIRDNAKYVIDMSTAHGGFGQFLAQWPEDDNMGLLLHLKKNGSRLGGHTGQYFLRFIGKDTYIFSKDVVNALIQMEVVSKEPTSQRDMKDAQLAFNTWREESGRPVCQISRVLAASMG